MVNKNLRQVFNRFTQKADIREKNLKLQKELELLQKNREANKGHVRGLSKYGKDGKIV